MNWTRLAGDVFRAPSCPVLFVNLLSIGIQYTFVSLLFVLIASVGGAVNVDMREKIYIFFAILSASTGNISGYVNARLYKYFNGTDWVLNLIILLLFVPIILQQGIFVTNIVNQIELQQQGEETLVNLSVEPFLAVWTIFNIFTQIVGLRSGFKAPKALAPLK